ncbi:MAG TPA: GNAT family N-acetyltransferase [Mobilitalea sp.]|nr:GNAT family N-acetyltransferase [Mobilitalea sp.]
MVIKEYEDAQAYLKENESILLKNEAVSQLILYNAYQNLEVAKSDKCIFGVVIDEERPLLHFCNVAPKKMAIYTQDIAKESIGPAANLLADYMVSNHIIFSGLIAKQEVCQAYIEKYQKSVDCTFLETLEMDIMEIRNVNDIKPVEGTHRLAVIDEVKMITDWMIDFQIEALASEINYETALNRATRLIVENKVYVYEDTDKRPVTMAVVSRQLVHGVAFNYVYTPEEFRGKGYAVANIYYMTKEYLTQGNEFCTLFVDSKNPISCRAYEKVGYQALENNYEYTLIPA